jgi:hypothetical protein
MHHPAQWEASAISRRSSSISPFDVPSGSSPSALLTPSPVNSKRRSSALEISGPTNSSKRRKASEGVEAIKEFTGVLGNFSGVVTNYMAQRMPPPPMPPPPPPLPPPPSVRPEHLDEAIKHFVESDTISKDSGDLWLSDHDSAKLVTMFERNPDLATTYLTLVRSARPTLIKAWVKEKLGLSGGEGSGS